MRVLVCGGRGYRDFYEVSRVLNDIHTERQITDLVHGGARGADTLAGQWAKANNIPVSVVPANWAQFGNTAGPRRNRVMLGMKPDLVVAFPGGKGTANMVKIAKAAGVKVEMVA